MDDEPEPPHYVPTWERITLRCDGCGYRWQDWQPAQVPADTWVAHVRAIGRCMRCGNKRKVFLVATP
jgi:hypothetical protein